MRLTDFGVARAANQGTRTTGNARKGKFAYFSPEQARGDALDKRSDIFALGIVTWEALAGVRLFRADNPLEGLRRIISDRIPDLREVAPMVPKEVGDLVARALAPSPGDRFATAQELHESIRRAMGRTVGFPDPVMLPATVRRYGASAIDLIERGVDPATQQPSSPPTAPVTTVPDVGLFGAARVGAMRQEAVRKRWLLRWIGAAALLAAVASAAAFLGTRLWGEQPKGTRMLVVPTTPRDASSSQETSTRSTGPGVPIPLARATPPHPVRADVIPIREAEAHASRKAPGRARGPSATKRRPPPREAATALPASLPKLVPAPQLPTRARQAVPDLLGLEDFDRDTGSHD